MPSNNCHLSTSLPAARLPPSRVYLSPITAVICISACAIRSQGTGTSHGDTQRSQAIPDAVSLGSRTHPPILTPRCALREAPRPGMGETSQAQLRACKRPQRSFSAGGQAWKTRWNTNGIQFVSDASPDIPSRRVTFSTPNPFALPSRTAGGVGVLQYDYFLVLHAEW